MKAPQPENRGRRYAGDLTRCKRRQDGRRAPHGRCSRRGVAVAQEGAAELPRKRTAFPATATALSAGDAPYTNFKALRPARKAFPAGRLMQGAPSFPSGVDAHSRCRDPWRTGKRRNRARRCKQGVSRNPRRHFRNERRLVRQRYFPQRNAMEKGMAISALIPFGGDASTNGMHLEKTRIRQCSHPLRRRRFHKRHAARKNAHPPALFIPFGGDASINGMQFEKTRIRQCSHPLRPRRFHKRHASRKNAHPPALFIFFGRDASINGMHLEKTRIRRRSIPPAAHPRQRSTDGKHALADLAHGPSVVSGGNAPHLLALRIQRDARCMLLLEHIL